MAMGNRGTLMKLYVGMQDLLPQLAKAFLDAERERHPDAFLMGKETLDGALAETGLATRGTKTGSCTLLGCPVFISEHMGRGQLAFLAWNPETCSYDVLRIVNVGED